MQTTASDESVQLTLPLADLSFLRTISRKMGWSLRVQSRSSSVGLPPTGSKKAASKQMPSSSREIAEREQTRPKDKSGIEKGLDDIRKGNVFHAMNSDDLIKQILG